MTRDVVVVGAGGFGRETLDVIDACARAGADIRVAGVVDSQPSAANLGLLRDRGIAYLGTEDEWLSDRPLGAAYLVGVGSPSAREQISARFDAAGATATVVIHPAAVIGTQARFGPGTIICGGVQISTNVSVGHHVHCNPGAIIGHDAVVEDFVSLNPGSIISGDVTVSRGALVGAGAVVLQGHRVGAGATVGAGACVVRDVLPASVVKGVPAR